MRSRESLRKPVVIDTLPVAEVSLHKDGPADWRVAVWGDDDYGLERSGMECAEAHAVFRKIKDGTTEESLRRAGFGRA